MADLIPYKFSLRPTILRTCITQPTRFPKAFALAYFRHALLVDTLWKLGVLSIYFSSCFILMQRTDATWAKQSSTTPFLTSPGPLMYERTPY